MNRPGQNYEMSHTRNSKGWMKFLEIFQFELIYQLSRLWTWMIFLALLAISYLMTRDGSLSEALHDDFFVNSPFAIAKTTVFGSLIWLMTAAVVAGDAAARDVAAGMHSLTYTLPVNKVQYLGGKFFAAFIINALILLAVQSGILLGVYLPGVDAQLIGPFRPAAYLNAYSFIAIPNAFVATAIQFSLATGSGRPMAAYLGSMILFIMSYVVGLFLFLQGRQDLANLLDLIGVHFILSELSHLWTPIEKSMRLLRLEGTILTNRLLWMVISLVVLTVTYIRFQFRHQSYTSWVNAIRSFIRKNRPLVMHTDQSRDELGIKSEVALNLQAAPRVEDPGLRSALRGEVLGLRSALRGEVLGLRSALRVGGSMVSESFRSIGKSWAGLFLLTVIPVLTIFVVVDQMIINEVPMVPKTGRVLSELTASLSAEMSRWVIIPLIIVYFAGELVWRERDAGLSEITDVMPGSEWPVFLGKFIGLGLVITLFLALLAVGGICAQVMMDYHDFEIMLYLKILLGLQLPEYLLFAILAMFVHVLVDHKYIGHLAAIMSYVFITLAPLFGIEHNLLIYGSGPAWSYTEMSGFGNSLIPWLWFKLYWTAWGLLIVVATKLLWIRGKEKAPGMRLRLARKRFNRSSSFTAALALGLIIVLGGLIFHNTNVINNYQTASAIKEQRAEYERLYGRYSGIPQPTLTGTNLQIDIFPRLPEVNIQGSYLLVNLSTEKIDSIHVVIRPGVETNFIKFNQQAVIVEGDSSTEVINQHHNYRIYSLEKSLEPGDSIRLQFQVHVKPHGFRENGSDPSVVANGTYFTNHDWLPAIGYQPGLELTSATERRTHGLAPRPLIASLYNAEARKERAERIDFNAIISTDEDQVAIAPGVLRRSWTDKNRRYFEYSSDAPIGSEQYFFSGNYALHEAIWKPLQKEESKTSPDLGQVSIRIYHDPRHTANLDRMVRTVRASLDYYTSQFGAYGHNQVSFIEHAGDGDGAGIHAEPGMLIVEEGFMFWNPKDEPGSLDHPFAVVAHEIAHQWTVPYAAVEGAPVLSESLAWYYAMKVVENARGHEQLQLLRNFMRQPHPHPPIRRGEPLLRGLDPYLSYRKGPFALYTLSRYISDEKLNAALRRLVEKHRVRDAPLATTLDLYAELKTATPDSLQYLLHDLFEVNTFWDLKTSEVKAKQTKGGTWQVELVVEAEKHVFDSAGSKTAIPMNDWIEIGVYDQPGENEITAKPMYVEKHLIRSGKQIITVTAPRKPVRAGIDPDYLLTDLQIADNIKTATIKL